MRMQIEATLTAAKIRADLRLLYAERALAGLEGLGSDPSYMADLLDDIDSSEERVRRGRRDGDRDAAGRAGRAAARVVVRRRFDSGGARST